MRCLSTGIVLILNFIFIAPCAGSFLSLPFPDIKGDGLGKFAVFDGTNADDTLLWRSNADNDNNRFRLWGLDSGTYYGVTFGRIDDNPGVLAAFCGFEAGRNEGIYDLSAGKLVFVNEEPPKTQDITGRVLHLTTGDIIITEGKVSIKSEQGEFTDPDKLEFFSFVFDKTSATGPAMTHDLFLGGPVEGHPATYNALKVSLTQALTPINMYTAFESDAHKWNPQKPTIIPLTVIKYKPVLPCPEITITSTCGNPTEQDIIDYLESTQPPAEIVEPATLSLMSIGLASMGLAGMRWKLRRKSFA